MRKLNSEETAIAVLLILAVGGALGLIMLGLLIVIIGGGVS